MYLLMKMFHSLPNTSMQNLITISLSLNKDLLVSENKKKAKQMNGQGEGKKEEATSCFNFYWKRMSAFLSLRTQ